MTANFRGNAVLYPKEIILRVKVISGHFVFIAVENNAQMMAQLQERHVHCRLKRGRAQRDGRSALLYGCRTAVATYENLVTVATGLG